MKTLRILTNSGRFALPDYLIVYDKARLFPKERRSQHMTSLR